MKIGRLPTIIIFLTIFLLTACQEKPQPITQITFTPSPTHTHTPRPSSTTSPTPSSTINQPINQSTITPTPIPTTRVRPTATTRPTTTLTPFPNILITPATPLAATGYRLKPWTAEDADNLGRLMEVYYDRLSRYFDFTITQLLANSYAEYPALAYWEAQHRFPDSHLQTHWQLGEVYHRAISNDPTASDQIQQLLLEALNSGQATPTLPGLASWLNNYPSSLSVQLEDLPPPPGYTGSYVIAIGIEGHIVGGTTFWILENEETYNATTLQSNLGLPHNYGSRLETAALIESETINLISTTGFARSGVISSNYFIYDLNEPNPIRLEFGPQRPWLFTTSPELILEEDENSLDHIIIKAYERYSCPLTMTVHFEWNGRWFEQAQAESQFDGNNNAEECYNFWLSKSSLYKISDFELADILTNFETKFGDFQPAEEKWIWQEYTPDAQDIVRFALAFNHAILGNDEQVQNYLQLIIQNPSIPDSQWIDPAEAFSAQYQSPQDLYPACLNAAPEICHLPQAFIHSIASLPPMDWPALQSQIIDWGTAVAASGSFDFDNDGETEHWLALRHQLNDPLELWLFSQWQEGWAAVYIDDVNFLPPNFQLETIYPSELTSPISFEHTIFSTNGEDIYAFYRHPVTQQPYTRRLFYVRPSESDSQSDQIMAIIQNLWDETDPDVIIDEMLGLTAVPTFTPNAQYYYYLGLAYEIADDKDNAVSAYLRAWQDYCCDNWDDWPIENLSTTANPYAIMAQAKLVPN